MGDKWEAEGRTACRLGSSRGEVGIPRHRRSVRLDLLTTNLKLPVPLSRMHLHVPLRQRHRYALVTCSRPQKGPVDRSRAL